MIKAIFFDLNGVLITSEYLSSRFEATYGIRGDEFISALKEVMFIARKPSAPTLYSLWKPYFEQWNLSLGEEDFLNFWFSGEKVNAEALGYVKELNVKGIDVFVLSNNFRERTQFYRESFPEIFLNVKQAYFSWETGNVKPNPTALEAVLLENNLTPKEVIYFDDSLENIQMAKNLGVDGQIWIDLQAAKDYVNTLIC